MTDYLAKLIRKRYPSGTELGIIDVSTWALFEGTEEFPIDTDKLQKKLDKIADHEAQLKDFYVYVDIHKWIASHLGDTEARLQECLLCIRQLLTMLKEAYAIEILRDYGHIKYNSIESTADESEPLEKVTRLLTPLEQLNTDGIWGDGKYPVVSSLDYMKKLYSAHQYITAYNFILREIIKTWNLPDVECLAIDTSELDDLIEEYHRIRADFVCFCGASLSDDRTYLIASYIPVYKKYEIPVKKKTRFALNMKDTTRGIFQKPIETAIADLTEE